MLGIGSPGIPLHPLIVHFPIVLAVLLPISALTALWVIRKGATPRWAWALPVSVAAALTISAYVATETGEREEDRVERVVAERAIHDHEEAAERFLVLSGILLLVAGVGLAPRTVGESARLLTAVGALGLLAAGVQVGHSGGALVYRHGAASAYTEADGADAPAVPAPVATAHANPGERSDGDDR
ncbi:MAG: DUF2231 domain-containing protein [Gemmatimonadaceae bacterium]